MKTLEGNKFNVGSEYKWTYYKGLYLKDYAYTATCIDLSSNNNNNPAAIFIVNNIRINYLVYEKLVFMEVEGKLCAVKQDVAIYAECNNNPEISEDMHNGIIYAYNKVNSLDVVMSLPLDEGMITLKEYATLHGVNPASVRQKILRGNLNAYKIGGAWFINKQTPYIDSRKKPQ